MSIKTTTPVVKNTYRTTTPGLNHYRKVYTINIDRWEGFKAWFKANESGRECIPLLSCIPQNNRVYRGFYGKEFLKSSVTQRVEKENKNSKKLNFF